MEQERTVKRVAPAAVSETTVSAPKSAPTNPIMVSEEAFTQFVRDQIERMQNSLLFKDKEPSMYELQMSLANWESVNFTLISLYESARWEHQAAKEAFDEWWSIKFMGIKNRENTSAVKRNSWLSATEIENTVRSENVEDIRAMKAAIMAADARKDMMSRLLDSWERYSWILNRLSSNSCAEINGSLKHQDVNLDPGDPQ